MKSKQEIEELLRSPYKEIEKKLNIRIRNGQSVEGIKKALAWVQEE